MASRKYSIIELQALRNTWIVIPVDAIPEQVRGKYLKRKLAVDMYIDGESCKSILRSTGISASNLNRLISKCLIQDEGNVLGYAALLPNHKISFSSESRPNQKEFGKLLNKYPSLVDFIKGNYFGDRKYTLEKNMNIVTLHNKFLVECSRLGIQEYEYPFNTKTKGYVSLGNYIRTEVANNPNDQAKRETTDNAQKILTTGVGERYTKNALVPFQCVQIDGHRIDWQYTVEIKNEDGTIERIVADRAWLIAVIDVATRCVLGFAISQELNYNQYDIIDAILNAIEPRKRMTFTISGLEYPVNGGYYSLAFEDLKYVLFDEIMLDNAKPHLSEYTRMKLNDELKCVINYGAVATPETRGIVERLFETLENRGFHRLPMTTGSNPKDVKRRNPEKAAIKYVVTFEEMLEFTETLIAEYNNTPHEGIDGLSPLESMHNKIYDSGLEPYKVDESDIGKIHRLRTFIEERIVRGKSKNGKRPYINLYGAEYRSPVLSGNTLFLGKKIFLEIDPRDVSTVEAYTCDGKYIDTLKARGEFGTKSHSLKTRRDAIRLAKERGQKGSVFDKPITALEQHLNEKGKKSRRAATKADIVRREQGIKSIKDENKKDAEVITTAFVKTDDIKYTSKDLKNLSDDEIYNYIFNKNA